MSSPEQHSNDAGPLSLDVFLADSLDQLCGIYVSATTLASHDDVVREVVVPMAEDATVSGESMAASVAQAAKESPAAPELILGPAAVALAYYTQCNRSLAQSDREGAWAYMAQCRWWTAVAIIVRQSPQLAAKIVTDARKQTASKGGRAKAEARDPVKEEAYRLVREGAPWPSKRQAAIRISAKVAEFAKNRRVSMSPDQITTTLQIWLAEMPDRDEFFPPKSGK